MAERRAVVSNGPTAEIPSAEIPASNIGPIDSAAPTEIGTRSSPSAEIGNAAAAATATEVRACTAPAPKTGTRPATATTHSHSTAATSATATTTETAPECVIRKTDDRGNQQNGKSLDGLHDSILH